MGSITQDGSLRFNNSHTHQASWTTEDRIFTYASTLLSGTVVQRRLTSTSGRHKEIIPLNNPQLKLDNVVAQSLVEGVVIVAMLLAVLFQFAIFCCGVRAAVYNVTVTGSFYCEHPSEANKTASVDIVMERLESDERADKIVAQVITHFT